MHQPVPGAFAAALLTLYTASPTLAAAQPDSQPKTRDASPEPVSPEPVWVLHLDVLAPLVHPADRAHMKWVSGTPRIIVDVTAPDADTGWNRVGRLRLLFMTARTSSGHPLIRFGVRPPSLADEPGEAAWSARVRGRLNAEAMHAVWPRGRVLVGGDTLDASALFHPAAMRPPRHK